MKGQPVGAFVFAYDHLAPAFPTPRCQVVVVDLVGTEAVVFSSSLVRRIHKPRRRDIWCIHVAAVLHSPVSNFRYLSGDGLLHSSSPEGPRPHAFAHPLRGRFAGTRNSS